MAKRLYFSDTNDDNAWVAVQDVEHALSRVGTWVTYQEYGRFNNQVTDDEAARAITHATVRRGLPRLILNGLVLEGPPLQNVIDCLARTPNKIRTLCVESCGLTSDDLECISRAIASGAVPLYSILAAYNSIEWTGILSLIRASTSSCSRLVALDVYSSFGADTAAESLVRRYLRSNPTTIRSFCAMIHSDTVHTWIDIPRNTPCTVQVWDYHTPYGRHRQARNGVLVQANGSAWRRRLYQRLAARTLCIVHRR